MFSFLITKKQINWVQNEGGKYMHLLVIYEHLIVFKQNDNYTSPAAKEPRVKEEGKLSRNYTFSLL